MTAVFLECNVCVALHSLESIITFDVCVVTGLVSYHSEKFHLKYISIIFT